VTARRTRHTRWLAARDTVLLYALVALGTAIGGTSRALVSALAAEVGGSGFPWGTLIVNVVGSFLIGLYATLTAPDGRLFVSTRQRQFMMAGIFGGFTTFSVFSLETFRLAAAGDHVMAASNVGVSVIAWLGAVWTGHALATSMNRLGGT
jgi:CrcB protein